MKLTVPKADIQLYRMAADALGCTVGEFVGRAVWDKVKVVLGQEACDRVLGRVGKPAKSHRYRTKAAHRARKPVVNKGR